MVNKRTKYGLNALLVLARAREEGPLSAAAIAGRARVPVKFLEAILIELRDAGMIASRKGRGGGHVLRMDPRSIAMTDVLRLFNGPIALAPCVSLNFYARCAECMDEPTCAVRDVLLAVRVATVRTLQAATLAELLKREERLRKAGRMHEQK